jgi:hypothetical protein
VPDIVFAGKKSGGGSVVVFTAAGGFGLLRKITCAYIDEKD